MIPLVQWGLCFLAGAGAGLLAAGAWMPFFILLASSSASLLGLGFLHAGLKGTRPVLAALLFFAMGALRATGEEAAFDRQQSLFPGSVTGSFRGTIVEDPEVLFEHAAGGHETGRVGDFYAPPVDRARAVVEISGLDGRPLDPVKVRCSFACPKEGGARILSYGDSVEVRGRLSLPPVAMNPGQFDYRGYLRNKGVAYVLFAAPRHWERLAGETGGSAFGRASYRFKRRIEDAVYSFLPFPENALLSGLLLGERASLSDEMLDAFAVTGTTHILAVSGMNTALIAALLFLGFRVLRAPRKAAALLSVAALASYVFMTGAPPSVCRAALFSSFALLALFLERKPHAGVLLVLTAALLTAWNPFSLMDLSFQLSFLAVMGLAVVTPPLFRRRGRIPAFLAADFAATCGAQLAVWGLLVFEFNLFATYSLIANLLIAPLVAAATAGGFAAVLAHLLYPVLGSLLGAGVEIPLKLLTGVTAGLSKWPRAEITIGTPPLGWILAYHALLLSSFLTFWPRPEPEAPTDEWRKRDLGLMKIRRAILGAWLAFLLLAAGASGWRMIHPRPFRAAFLSVGHGNSAVLRAPTGEVVVVDGGRGTDGPARWNPLIRYLRHEGVGRVDAVINTHPDSDHVGGLVNLLSVMEAGRAYLPVGAFGRSRTAWEFGDLLAERKIPLQHLRRGDAFQLPGGIQVSVLHPPAGFKTRKHGDNNLSLVLQLSYPVSDGRFLLTLPGDLEREGLESLRRVDILKGGWLLAPHHGRNAQDNAVAASLFEPSVVVLSDSKDHPDTEQAIRSSSHSAKFLPLNRTGCVEVEIDTQGRANMTTFLEK